MYGALFVANICRSGAAGGLEEGGGARNAVRNPAREAQPDPPEDRGGARARVRVVMVGSCCLFGELLREHVKQIPGLVVRVRPFHDGHSRRAERTERPDVVVCQLYGSREQMTQQVRAVCGPRARPKVLALLCQAGMRPQVTASRALDVAIVRPADGLAFFLAELGRLLPAGDVKQALLRAGAQARGSRDGRRPSDGRPLTERQLEVLRMAARGWTSRRIAQELGLSTRTVDSHRSNLLKRLGVGSTAEAVRKAIRRGLIT